MSILRYYLLLALGVFFLIGFIGIIGTLFVALLPIIIPITLLLILFAFIGGRKHTVVFTREETQPPPPASQDTIDITAVEVEDK